ncbi:MAG: hypothetical protein PHE15_07260 [Dehalococcoidales bacterium]|nr:hypothetical protein [Dehalococcoidales bacterium]
MKIVAGLQIFLGFLAEYAACYIAIDKENSIISEGFNPYPVYLKISLTIIGIVII